MDFEGKSIFDKMVIIMLGVGIIALYMAFSPFLITVLSATPLANSYIGKNIIFLVSEILILACLIAIFHKRFFKDFKDFKKNYKKYLKKVIPYWVIGFIIMMFSNIVINLIITPDGMAANEAANRNILGQLPIYSVISMCIIGPICEELMFRVSFRKAFSNIIVYSLFTGLFFAAMHVTTGIESWHISYLLKHWQELLYFIPYGSIGFALGYSFYKTDNIFSSISLHVMHNSLTVLLILLPSIMGA